MSENAAIYNTDSVPPLSYDLLRSRACCKPFSDHGYLAPTGHEIDSLINFAGWTQNEFAEIVGVSSSSKGSSTVRRWKCKPESTSYRCIPYAAWRLALLESGLLNRMISDI